MLPPRLGLNRLMTFEERQNVERELSVSFADIYSMLDDAHNETRELEKILDSIFCGSSSQEC